MKTVKGLLLAVVLVLTNGAFAGTNKNETASAELEVKIEAQADGKVIVGFEKLETEKVQIKIFSDLGLVHSETVKDSKKILKRFDLSNLPAGRYSYTVTNGLYSVTKVIEKE